MKARNCLVVLVNIIMVVIFSVYSASAVVINSTVCSAGADYTTIQDAVDAAKDGSNTYNITLCNDETFVENVSIYSDVDLTITSGNAIIDGGGTDRVISITNVSTQNITLDGLTITNGSSTYGGGIYVYYSSPSITNCVVENNTATNQGGGIYFYHSPSSSITNCIIEDNTNQGLRAVVSSNNLKVFDSTFRNNGSGASFADSWNSHFTRCTFMNNSGGGVGASDSPGSQFINCLFAKNAGGAIAIGEFSANSKIFNCTVGANTGYSSSVYYRNGTGHSIINSIVWGNEAGILLTSGTVTVTHSAIQGGWEGEGNIEDDPLFSSPEDDDFGLRCASPAKDSGDDSFVYSPDLAGQNRSVGNAIDMGAYEYQSTASCPEPTDLYVGDSEIYTTIQDAIDAAKDDDTIWVDQGTYEENIDFKGKDVKVIAEYSEYPGLTTIDGGTAGNVVTFDTYEGTGAQLNGFTITKGYAAADGGGISLANFAMPSITNCIITDNTGNGIYMGYAFGNITDSIISSNTGEGIEASHSDLTVTNSVIEGNGSSGIYVKDYSYYSLFSYNTIENNSSSIGGGIRIGFSGYSTLDNCLIRNNTASNAGGGVFFGADEHTVITAPYISSCTIDNNSGCGVFITDGINAKFINSLITNNVSGGGYGSAIYIDSYSQNTELINSTVSDNIGATSSIYYRDLSWGGHSIINSIVWGNEAGIDNDSSLTVTYSDIQGGWTGTGNINTDPDFVDSTAGNYHLNASSSCINAGTTVNVFTDLDGNVRPVGFAYDMGAYEYNDTTDYGIISGYVMDYTNNPISAATVTLREYESQGNVLATTTSNSDGYYEFNSLSNRIYIIDAEDGSLLNRRTGKTNKSLPWAQEEFINLYLNE